MTARRDGGGEMNVPFEDALCLGIRTAAVVVERAHGPRFAQCVYDYEAGLMAKIRARQRGCREMVADDIFLPMPMMRREDLGI